MALILGRPGVRPIVDRRHPLARDLVFAGVPVAQGYWDASIYGNHALMPTSVSAQRVPLGAGSAYAFDAGTGYFTTRNVHTPPLASTGYSIALWCRFNASPNSYGSLFGRYGTTGATDAGGDWTVVSDGIQAKPALARSGAILASGGSSVSTGLWYLWHLSVDGSGNYSWWLSGIGAEDTIGRGAGSGTPTRTASGVFQVNADGLSGGSSNNAVGRVYIWNRATSIDDARMLYRREASLFAPHRILVPHATSGYTHPTLSNARMGSVTSTGGVPLVDYVF